MRRIVREYIHDVSGLDFTVKGRITHDPSHDENMPYMWEISHHYRPSENAMGVYYPSKLSAQTEEDAYYLLKMYMDSFTTIDVKPNTHY